MIAWYDNVPVLSWLLLRARCRACKRPISARYPLVEALTALLFVLVARRTDVEADLPLALSRALFLSAMVAVAFIDWDTRLIPDAITIPGIVTGLLLSLLVPSLHDPAFLPDVANRHVAALAEGAAGALAGGGLLLVVRWLGTLAFKREAMGLGDVKLLAMAGAFTSPIGIVYALMLGSLLGAIVGSVFVIVRRRSFATVAGHVGPARASFDAARVRPDRLDLRVASDAFARGERVDVSLVIPADVAWFEHEVRLALHGAVESVVPLGGGRAIVRVALEEPDDVAADALSTFAHARVAVPFGPFLAAGASAVVLYAGPIARFVTEEWPRLVSGRGG
jgi:leader peptidase (prepilin peptidase)/N-methyltransferase